MPYLLDLPPLDQAESDLPRAQINEIPSDASDTNMETKTKPKKKGTAKEIDTEKWHSDNTNCDLHRKLGLPSVSSKNDANKINCDTKYKYIVDLKISTSKKYIALTEHDMAILRRLSESLMKKLS